MPKIANLEDIKTIRESVEVECKLAAGRDGRGQLPEDFWPTYSAFANTRGGLVLLGIREEDGNFSVNGIQRIDKVRQDLFNGLNNPQKASNNLLSDEHVTTIYFGDRQILAVEIPQAPRNIKPVYTNNNPMTGTYRRLNDGDRRCDRDTVHRMLAERSDSRDDQILKGFKIDDLDAESIRLYRSDFRLYQPNHVFLDQNESDFLRSIGVWRRDRETGEEGITAAGVLMFGRYGVAQDVFPNYVLDYQEQEIAATDVRWIDRITIDGNWSGNLFDFYKRVYRKLVLDLRVPFELKDGRRIGETPVHEAIREALVNVVVHADYVGSASILVIKRADKFSFRNPGLMRVPPELARRGGDGDARNRRLQHMFFLIGASDRAGSGVPKIYRNWEDQHWRPPTYEQLEEPFEQTRLELNMVDLLPPAGLDRLRRLFGQKFDSLSKDERLILATANAEGNITHSRMKPVCNQHPADLTRMLQGLVSEGFLEQSGRSRGTTYHLPDPDFSDIAPSLPENTLTRQGDPLSLGTRPGDLGTQPGDLGSFSGELVPEDLFTPLGDAIGRGSASGADDRRGLKGAQFPVISNLDEIDLGLLRSLRAISSRAESVPKASPALMYNVIEELCEKRYLTLKTLSNLVGRNQAYLRDEIINPMVSAGMLVRAHPAKPNHPRQAYLSTRIRYKKS